MAPVFGGMAIGLMIGVPILVLAILIRWLMAAGYFTLGFVRAARWDWAAAHTPEAIAARAQRAQARHDAAWARADAIRARGLARNERTRQWLVKHHVPFARLLTRSIAG